IQGHYGLLIFQQEGNPIFITDKKDSSIILNAIDENWKNRPKKESFFENGLFYIFSFIADLVRKKSKFNRIIVITDTPSDLSEDYTEALFGLVSKIKTFPTFIDIVRVSEGKQRFFTDDVKLNILANDTKGGIFYIQDKKDFFPLIKRLIKSKQLINTFQEKPEKVKINKEDYFFYSHLAKKLKSDINDDVGLKCSLCKEEICPICMEVDDKLLICEECKTPFHNCCITNYTIQNNIGIPHIFRCPNCDILLQIEQDEIVKPFDAENESVNHYLEVNNLVNTLNFSGKELSNEKKHSISTQESEYQLKPRSNSGTMREEKSKIVRIGGFFGKVYTVKKDGNKLIYQKVENPHVSNNNLKENNLMSTERHISNDQITEEPHIWKPSLEKTEQAINKEKYSFTICSECGHQITAQNQKMIKCPYCGYNLDN
ncbi:MAG: hypothetical protein ACFFKA_17425, partial [Candidatus Thorarchaeota archaeon]